MHYGMCLHYLYNSDGNMGAWMSITEWLFVSNICFGFSHILALFWIRNLCKRISTLEFDQMRYIIGTREYQNE